MVSPRTVVIPLIIFSLALPPALAAFAAMGNHEPNTAHDLEGNMFLAPDTSDAGNLVYFNGFITAQTPAGGLGASPSVAAEKAQTAANPMSYVVNLLMGVWKDCNHDGYIGDGDQGLWEYRSEILTTESSVNGFDVPAPCEPVATRPASGAGLAAWHNDGQWVREYIPIGWANWTGGQPNAYAVTDSGARAWYDNEYFDDAPLQSCSLNPPTGSLHSTGGILFFADCTDNWHGTDAFDSVADQNDATRPLSFSDSPHDQYASRSLLNQRNPYGDASDASDAQVWDCEADATPITRDPTAEGSGAGSLHTVQDPTGTAPRVDLTGDDGYIGNTTVPGVVRVNPLYYNLSAPRAPPGSMNTAGSPAGTLNETLAGTDQCERDDRAGGGRGGTANAVYALETPVAQSDLKRHSASVLYPSPSGTTGTGTRPAPTTVTPPAPTGQAPVTVESPIGTVLGPSTPMTLGTHVTSTDGIWHDTVVWTSKYTSRHYTFYGSVSAGAIASYGLTLPRGPVAGDYQQTATNCGADVTDEPPTGGATIGPSNPHNGVDCNKGNWWLSASGVDVSQRSPFLGKDPSLTGPCTPASAAPSAGAGARGCYQVSPYPGDAYSLRDTDCVDDVVGPARQAPVHQTVVPGTVAYDTCDAVG